MKSIITAIGNKREEIKNDSASQVIYSDCLKTSGGLEENFSPTDYIAVAFASCAMIGMEIFAAKKGYDFTGCYAKADKEVDMKIYQISKIKVEFHLKKEFPEEFRSAIEKNYEKVCIVERSLKEEIKREITFFYDVE